MRSGTGKGCPSCRHGRNEKRADHQSASGCRESLRQPARVIAECDRVARSSNREVVQLTLMRERQHGAETSCLHVATAHIMMRGHLESSYRGDRALRGVFHDRQQGVLRRPRAAIDQVLNEASCGPTIAACGIGGETLHVARQPVIAAGETSRRIHPPVESPLIAIRRHDKRMEIQLEAVGDRVVVDACCEPAGSARASPFIPTASAIAIARSSSGVRSECLPRPPHTPTARAPSVRGPSSTRPSRGGDPDGPCPSRIRSAWNQKGSLNRARKPCARSDERLIR